MISAPFVPPLKCQGIKTKLVRDIVRFANCSEFDRWVEPFCGSCVVPLNASWALASRFQCHRPCKMCRRVPNRFEDCL